MERRPEVRRLMAAGVLTNESLYSKPSRGLSWRIGKPQSGTGHSLRPRIATLSPEKQASASQWVIEYVM
jgi:hypothetical protein